jgi:UDP-N-acetyl-D-glucosamine dehydrogenase
MNRKEELIKMIASRKALVGVIGMGYVGLPIALRFAESGIRALGFDIDPAKVKNLANGKSYIRHIPSAQIALRKKEGMFSATADFSHLAQMDVIIVAVPTPLTEKKEPDLSYVVSTADTIAKHIRPGQAVILESTTYPGTTRELLLPRFESAKMKVGRDFFLIFSPEREDPGNEKYKIQDIPKVVGGMTPACLAVGKAVYGSIVGRVVAVSSPEAAEMTKLLENIFRGVNIALVNEMKMLLDRMGIDIWEVIRASSTKPFGYMPFYPGPGLGGHCIPIDPFYLTWKAKEFDFTTRFIELSGEINSSIPYWVVGKLSDALNVRKKCLNGARILLLGAAYKKNVDDMRESPTLVLINLLKKAGAAVSYHDPFIPRLPRTRHFDLNMKSVPLTASTLKKTDAVVIVTDHDQVDYKLVADHAPFTLDTRDAMRRVPGAKNVIKA